MIAVAPLKGDLTVNTTIVPFFTEIIPNHPERTEEAKRANTLDVEKLMWEGLDCWRVADFFEKWFERLRLGFRKAIIPLAHNWSHDASFILQWLGHPSYSHFFYGYRDTMSVLNHLNGIADFNNEAWPFPKMSLGSFCNRLGVENLNPHDALGDAVATAECYRRLVTRYKIYG